MPNKVFDSLYTWFDQWTQVANDLFETVDDYAQSDYYDKLDKIYDLYAENVPQYDEPKTLSDDEKDAYKEAMIEVEDEYKYLSMFGQDDNRISIKEAVGLGGDDFAFFMQDIENKNVNEGNARLTLSFDPKKAKEAFGVLAKYLDDIRGSEEAASINSLKVLGPDFQGERTDSAIIYLSRSDKTIIDKIVKDLDARFAKAEIARYDHTPLGMKKMASGFAFSQQGPFSSSHGFARAKIISDATDIYFKKASIDFDESEEAKKRALQESLRINGYNLEEPESLDMLNYVENLETTEVDSGTRRDILKRYIGSYQTVDAAKTVSMNGEMFGHELNYLSDKYELQRNKYAEHFTYLNEIEKQAQLKEEQAKLIAQIEEQEKEKPFSLNGITLSIGKSDEDQDENKAYAINGKTLSLDSAFSDDYFHESTKPSFDMDSQEVEKDIVEAMVYGKIMRFRDLFGMNKEVEGILENHTRQNCEELAKEDRLFKLHMQKVVLSAKLKAVGDKLPKEATDKTAKALQEEINAIEKEEKEVNDRIVVLKAQKETLDEIVKKVRQDMIQKRQQLRNIGQKAKDDKSKDSDASHVNQASGSSADNTSSSSSPDNGDKKPKSPKRRKK